MSDQSHPAPAPALTPYSVELLLDLVEIKLAAMDIEDRDELTISHLKRCRDQLKLFENAARGAASRTARRRPRPLYATA